MKVMTPVVVLVSWLVLVKGQVVAPSPSSPPPAHNQTRGRGRGAVTRRSGVAPHRAECGWVCGDECFVADMICDSFEQCDDNSDEGRAPHQGCNLFPESGCWSHRGRRHYKVGLVFELHKIMIYPQYGCTQSNILPDGWKMYFFPL